MSTFAGRLSLAFGAGCLGGLVNSIVVWFLGDAGLPARLGVQLAPDFTLAWLYPRIVWGGLWGGLLLLPIASRSHLLRGLIASLAPSAFMLLWLLPSAGKGLFGTGMGWLTPAFVLVYNAVWGIAAGFWFALASGQTRRL